MSDPVDLCPCCNAPFTKKPRCPSCGNAHSNRRTDNGWWRCGKCDDIFQSVKRWGLKEKAVALQKVIQS